MSLTTSPLADAPYAATIHTVELDDFGHSFRPVAPGLFTCPIDVARPRPSTTATSCARSCAPPASARSAPMLLLRRARPATASEPTDQVERSHTLVPLTGATARAWPVYARRCLHRLPERLRWAAPLLDPDHPSALDVHARAGARAAAVAAPPAELRAPDRRLPPAPARLTPEPRPPRGGPARHIPTERNDDGLAARPARRVARPRTTTADTPSRGSHRQPNGAGLFYAACSRDYAEEICGCPICRRPPRTACSDARARARSAAQPTRAATARRP